MVQAWIEIHREELIADWNLCQNGETRIFDMKPYLDLGTFKELKDKHFFNTVGVCFDSIAWANEADFDPEALYSGSIKPD